MSKEKVVKEEVKSVGIMEPLPPPEPGPQPDVKAIDAKTVMFMVYTLYKLNLITRLQVRDFLDLVKSNKVPGDLTEYLLGEVKKI